MLGGPSSCHPIPFASTGDSLADLRQLSINPIPLSASCYLRPHLTTSSPHHHARSIRHLLSVISNILPPRPCQLAPSRPLLSICSKPVIVSHTRPALFHPGDSKVVELGSRFRLRLCLETSFRPERRSEARPPSSTSAIPTSTSGIRSYPDSSFEHGRRPRE